MSDKRNTSAQHARTR